ncbi:Methionine ABC transporter ATP-binding protein [Acidisarcina polymorpha]|uniref:Methionine ABC transporter ATP-binding protein n=1 Tax=Acidisarcina polymorpha TaxID=2211140 RepID=A0A2Z5G042_9BACT|nr:ATP-binding cassette domain-containing protein [Acidisarcina polymorpha]AXC12015.1 Methionine ABC transporter ATP-binding protein [Acidisarcina polymorpha]
MSEGPVVEFCHVSKRFGRRNILCDVSFQVGNGEALCILGRSGVGKSVTLKLIIGLLKPDMGDVFIESESIVQFNEEDLTRVRRKMGFLFQSAALFDSFSVANNLALPLQRLEKNKSADEIKRRVDEALQQVGLASDKEKMPVELSGGMRKRAGLARALVLNPRILLIDEPSSGLDPITASEIDDLLLKIKQERHTTMIIVTHDVRGARRVADKVAVLDEGALVGFGSFADLEHNENDTVCKLLSES